MTASPSPWTTLPQRSTSRLARTAGWMLAALALASALAFAVVAPARPAAVAGDPQARGTAGDAASDGPSPGPVGAPVPTSRPEQPALRDEATRPRRTSTAEQPLRVWIAGDSMWETAGPALAARFDDTGRAITTVDVRYSSGLTRPDFFDWHAHAAEALRDHDPEVVFFLAGANDSQPLSDAGATHRPGTVEFSAVYAHRVRALMTLLSDGDRQVVWVGLPIMRRRDYDERLQVLTRLADEVAATCPGVTYVSTRDLFANPDGQYTPTLPDADGTVRLVRAADGIHLSGHGAQRLANHLFDLVWSDLP